MAMMRDNSLGYLLNLEWRGISRACSGDVRHTYLPWIALKKNKNKKNFGPTATLLY